MLPVHRDSTPSVSLQVHADALSDPHVLLCRTACFLLFKDAVIECNLKAAVYFKLPHSADTVFQLCAIDAGFDRGLSLCVVTHQRAGPLLKRGLFSLCQSKQCPADLVYAWC